MTKKEMETEIINLKRNLAVLAEKSHDHETSNENKISVVDSTVNQQGFDIETLSDYSTELLFEICLLKLGISEEDFNLLSANSEE